MSSNLSSSDATQDISRERISNDRRGSKIREPVCPVCDAFSRREDWSAASAGPPSARGVCRVVIARTQNIERLGKNVKEAQRVMRTLRDERHRPTIVTWSAFIGVLTQAGQCHQAEAAMKEMRERDGLDPDVMLYNLVINGWCRKGRVGEARALLSRMISEGAKPSNPTYNTLMKGYTLAGRPADAQAVLDEMVAAGVAPNLTTFNMLVNAWCEEGNTDAARAVMVQMRGHRIRPDVVTYNTLMKGYGKGGDPVGADGVLSEMELALVQPTVVTYAILMNCWCETGMVHDTWQLLRRMLSMSVQPNRTIFNTIIKGYIKAGDLVNAEAVLGVMRSNGIPPDVASYSTVMDAWSGKGDVGNMMRLFRRMTEEDVLVPDTTAYSILAKGYSRAKQPHHCEALLDEMASRWQLSPNVVTFTTVINCWCNAGQMDKAAAVFGRMRAAGVAPNYETYNTLVRGHGQSHDPRSAEAVLEMMRGAGVPPDTLTMDFVVDAWLKVGNAREAERVYRDAVAQGLKAHPARVRKDPVTLGRKGRLPGAGAGKPGLADGPTPVKKPSASTGQSDKKGKGGGGAAPSRDASTPTPTSPRPSAQAIPGSQGQANSMARDRGAARAGMGSGPPQVGGGQSLGAQKQGPQRGEGRESASRSTDASAPLSNGARDRGQGGQARAGDAASGRSAARQNKAQGPPSPTPIERNGQVPRSSLASPGRAAAASATGSWDGAAGPRNGSEEGARLPRADLGVSGSGHEGSWSTSPPRVPAASGAPSVPEGDERVNGWEGADAAMGSRVRTSATPYTGSGGAGGLGSPTRGLIGGASIGRRWVVAVQGGRHGRGASQGVSVVRRVRLAQAVSGASLGWLVETGVCLRAWRDVSQKRNAKLALGQGELQPGPYLLRARGLHGALSGRALSIRVGGREETNRSTMARPRVPHLNVAKMCKARGSADPERHLPAAMRQARLATVFYLR